MFISNLDNIKKTDSISALSGTSIYEAVTDCMRKWIIRDDYSIETGIILIKYNIGFGMMTVFKLSVFLLIKNI